MAFFFDTAPDDRERPHEEFRKWKAARRARRKELDDDGAPSHVADNGADTAAGND